MAQAGHALLAAEQPSQWEVAEHRIGQGEGDERLALGGDTSQAEERHMVYLENPGQAESPADRSVDLEGEDRRTDMDAVEI